MNRLRKMTLVCLVASFATVFVFLFSQMEIGHAHRHKLCHDNTHCRKCNIFDIGNETGNQLNVDNTTKAIVLSIVYFLMCIKLSSKVFNTSKLIYWHVRIDC